MWKIARVQKGCMLVRGIGIRHQILLWRFLFVIQHYNRKTKFISNNNLFHTLFYKKEDRLTIRKYKYYYNGAGKLE
jgi:hypothetical protein